MGGTKHVFLSDVHIGAFSPKQNHEIEADLIRLIDHCRLEGYRLYVLGDLFDYWMEYPEKGFVPELGKNVLDAFEAYNKMMDPALFITGNHDNWTYGHFEDRGFDTESNFRLTDIENKRFLLMHGDGVEPEGLDFPRAAFHQFLRSEYFVRIYQKILPPKAGLATMKWFSSVTRKRNYMNPDPLNRQAEKIFNRKKIDFIMTGHDHIPRVETFSGGIYINLGTFFKHRSVAIFEQGDINLQVWHSESNKFLPFDIIKDGL
ncbi:UDP-2,3-diacylglucosamine diphosphatase [Balneola sp. MJW-20]|uniref:UDP-2,3-diacylglucosamine diphosphatase n=1 Tax=Gracilimonas aurantiaca TaxID=3234185 RepID=UPI00346660E8